MKRHERALFQLPSFWLALSIPLLLALGLGYISTLGAGLSFSFNARGLAFALDYFLLPLLILLLLIPAVMLVAVNHRSQQRALKIRHGQQQDRFANHYLHVEQFGCHAKAELLKRLGISSRVLHQVFFPQSLQGDFAIHTPLVRFVYLQFAGIVQAAQVINQLQQGADQDEDEKAVATNRLEFVMTRSVLLMSFFARQVRGQRPDCLDFYFLKDAMADYFDLINEVVNFDGICDDALGLSDFNRLFERPAVKSWFARNDNFLRLLCRQTGQENPLFEEYRQYQMV